MQLTNKLTIVTGAGRNIGAGIAARFAREGAKVAIVDLVEERAQVVADQITAMYPGGAIPIRCDVTNGDDVQAMVKRVVAEWGYIDTLVNNVGVVDRGDILSTTEAEWNRVIAVSLTSVFLVSKYVAQSMVDHGHGGRIINISSTSGHQGRP